MGREWLPFWATVQNPLVPTYRLASMHFTTVVGCRTNDSGAFASGLWHSCCCQYNYIGELARFCTSPVSCGTSICRRTSIRCSLSRCAPPTAGTDPQQWARVCWWGNGAGFAASTNSFCAKLCPWVLCVCVSCCVRIQKSCRLFDVGLATASK